MPLLSIVLTLVVIGVVLYCVNTFIPMEARIKSILNIVVLIIVVFWLLSVFGILGYLGNVSTPRVR